jgi:protoporphyrin/coproporphyrin ferrochelatase
MEVTLRPSHMNDPEGTMNSAVLLLNFGEPEDASLDCVIDFLDRIFRANGQLDEARDPAAVALRSRRMAEARAPALLDDYRRIGGSPMNGQAREQADRLGEELARRGHEARVFVGMQFTEPSIAAAVAAAREWGADHLVALPVYPICGPSTTVAALESVRAELDRLGWPVAVSEIAGFHDCPAYVEMRAGAIVEAATVNGISLADHATRLVFSAHGTPIQYLSDDSRYDHVTEQHCAEVAAAAGVAGYSLGYQNHGHRPTVPWTQPEIGSVLDALDAEVVIVDPVSFMHEQSETLIELDHEMRELAEARGMRFIRVPIRHAAPEFITMLADLTEPLLGPVGVHHDGQQQASSWRR